MQVLDADDGKWLGSGQWYSIISPKYEYLFVIHAKSIDNDVVKMAILQQVDENSNKFTDENQVEFSLLSCFIN